MDGGVKKSEQVEMVVHGIRKAGCRKILLPL